MRGGRRPPFVSFGDQHEKEMLHELFLLHSRPVPPSQRATLSGSSMGVGLWRLQRKRRGDTTTTRAFGRYREERLMTNLKELPLSLDYGSIRKFRCPCIQRHVLIRSAWDCPPCFGMARSKMTGHNPPCPGCCHCQKATIDHEREKDV